MSRCDVARAILLLAALCSFPGRQAAAQPPAATPAYQPPAVRFDPKGLALLDAVKLTLEHDPNVKLREADAESRAGALRSQQGRFDMVLRGSGGLNREQVELTDTEKARLQEVRDDLRLALTEVTALSDSLLAAANTLNDPRIYTSPASLDFTAGIRDYDIKNQMSILGSQLVLYYDILRSPQLTDPTVKADIVDLRQQTVGKNISNFLAQRDTIAGAPAQLAARLEALGPAPEEQWNRQGDVRLDLSKEFRSGLFVRPYLDLTYTASNYVGKKESSPDAGGLGVEPLYRGDLGFEVILPLARGRGRASVGAAETAARYDLEASRLALLHQQSQSVLTTVQAYWEARAAADRVEVMRRSVELQGQFANLTRALIAANEKPRSEEARVMASTADARSRYEAAQRRLTDARITLAKVMGVALADALFIPLASDPPPRPPALLQADPSALTALVKEAIARRYDRQASLKLEASGKALVDGARIDTRAVLDVNGKVWGTSLQEKTPGYNDWVVRSGSIGIDYERPFGNNTAVGRLDQSEASYRQARIDTANLERVIALNITQYAEAVKLAADRLAAAEEAVRNYDETIKAEAARLKAGDSSLINTILTEQQTTSARLSLIDAQQEYSTLLALLGHEAGLLVQDGVVNLSSIVAVPAALQRR